MSLQIDYPSGHTLGECRELKVHGLPGVGGYALVVALMFSVNRPKADTHLKYLHLRLDWGTNTQKLIGIAIPDGAQPIQVPNSNTMTLYFRLFLAPAQVEAIESLRLGEDFALSCSLNGEISQDLLSRGLTENGIFTVTQSQWVRVLEQMGYTQTMLYEVPLGRLDSGGNSKEYVDKARKYLHRGEYDLCVGECRKIFELYPLRDSSRSVLGAVRKKYSAKDERESMSVDERWVLLRDVLMLLTHPPHHSEQTSSYSRDQAKMVFSATLSYCSC